MGCGQSKIENEETVTRCKERKQFMKEAVSGRNAFAAAHSAYAMSLKNTGAALSDYAHGEVQSYPNSTASPLPGGAGGVGGSSLPQPPVDPFPPPPPPLPPFLPPPLQRAATMPEMNFPKPSLKHSDSIIEEEENEDEVESESVHGLKHRVSKSIGGGIGGIRNGVLLQEEEDVVVQEEDLPKPPSPPPPRPQPPPKKRETPPPPPPEMKGMPWEFFFSPMDHIPGPTLAEVDEGRMEREEFERRVLEERAQSSEIDAAGGANASGGGGTGSDGGARKSDAKPEPIEVIEKAPEPPQAQMPPQPQPAATKTARRVKQGVPSDAKRRGASSVNLLHIFSELDDHFLKASQGAHEVSKMLEAARLHYHSNFADNRGHIDHSAKVMRVITWNRSFRGLPNADDGKDDLDLEEHETHATVLDKMLAWEKKLYDEVKAAEHMKVEYQRKVNSLSKLKNRGSNIDALERMKATVSHLHTRYIVDMQSMDSTVSEINRLRDEQLYPKLVSLVDGMATMWESMRGHHENQSEIVLALRSLDVSQSSKETTEHHHERTVQLWHVISEWHAQFDKMVIHQKEYIRALNNWLKLNLIPIDTNLKEKVSSPQRPQRPAIQLLITAWLDYLEKLPDELARGAINNFAAVVNTIMQYQIEEMKLRDRCELTKRELTKKTQQFEDWYSKHMQKRTPPDEMDPDRSQDKDQIAERQAQVEAIKTRLELEEEEYQRQCIQVREKSLTSLKSRLPEVFLAMTAFSLECSNMFKNLKSLSQRHARNES